MSSLVTISLGLKGNPIFNGMEDLLSATSLIMSAAVSAIAALEAFLDPRALWIKFTNTLWALYRLKDDVEFKAIAPKPVSTEDLDLLYQRLQGLLIEANAAYPIEGSQPLTQRRTRKFANVTVARHLPPSCA